MSDTPAGWYTDPQVAGQQRYWDGQQWTEHRHVPVLVPGLVPCRSCKGQVAKKAKTCPHCGTDNPSGSGWNELTKFAMGFVLFLIVVAVLSLARR